MFSVVLGNAAGFALPVLWVKLSAGGAFIIFGVWALLGDEPNDQEHLAQTRFGPFMTVAISFFLAELGDKTMLATVTIASEEKSFGGVWLGSTVGMVAADGLAIIAGKVLGKKLPEKLIKYGAAFIFIASGIFTLRDALQHR